MDYEIGIATGVVIGVFYLFMGLGVARLLLKTNGKFSAPSMLFWPVALCIYAATGEINL